MRLIALLAVSGLLTANALAQTHPTHPEHPTLKASPTRPPAPKKTTQVVKATQATPIGAATLAAPEPETIDADRLAVAPLVLVGEARCEHGKTVGVKPHPSLAGRFLLTHGRDEYTLTPQPTSTGVVRLENAHAGIVWLQVPIKSMLMDAKRGQRMADSCLHAEQVAEVEAMKTTQTR
jgi:hypothetical protein